MRLASKNTVVAADNRHVICRTNPVSLSDFTAAAMRGGSNDACVSQFTPAAPTSSPSMAVSTYSP